MIRLLLTVGLIVGLFGCQPSLPEYNGNFRSEIRLNQIGYYPGGPKKLIVATDQNYESFSVVDVDKMQSVYDGQLSEQLNWELAGETVQVGDFSDFETPGSYSILIDGLGYSYPFEVKPNVLNEAFLGSVKGLYYQRSSFALEEAYAGKWQRALGHPDDSVLFHSSSGKQGVMSSPGGWYDAGDYGKYVVNGAFPLGQLLMLYEHYPEAIDDGSLNIPESRNGVSDYLDELKYEMDWLLTMQDEDGGLFFKQTTETFEGMILPESAKKQRYIFRKGTAPTLDFAACAAKASRVFKDVDTEYAATCLEAARKAWLWATANPDNNFKNPEGVITGEYGDTNFTQEFYWAAAELYAATRESSYLDYNKANPMDFAFTPGESWANFMHYLGAFTIIDHTDDDDLAATLTQQILQAADELVAKTKSNDYLQPISDFQWGSNSDIANSALIAAQAYRLDPKPEYLVAVQEINDYIFGKNATGYSFLTGFGDKTPMFVHHRPSAGDNVEEPVPGLLSGGPNSRQQDKHEVTYPENAAPMKCWVDQEPSFASNEICLNWNAPLTYVLGFLEQETSKGN